jgi:purine-nucleoside phosphorylase
MEFKAATAFFSRQYKKLKIPPPDFHVVLGSALGGALDSVKHKGWNKIGEFSFAKVPGLPVTKVAGHKGVFALYRHDKTGRTVIFQGGRVHGYEGHTPRKSVLPVMASRLAGTKNFVLTNASGSLNKSFLPGSAMVIRDHVNLTGHNPLVGENPKGGDGKDLGPRFPDMGQCWSRDFSTRLSQTLAAEGLTVHSGVYLGLMGPTYETPAEVKLFSGWGLDAVGMSTVWEAIALRHSGASLCGVALMTNYACGLMGDEDALDHQDLLKTTSASAQKVLGGVFGFLGSAGKTFAR